MRLPALSLIIVSQLVVWCVAGAVIHGWAILLYPLSWALIGAAFYLHNKKYPIQTSASDEVTKEAPKQWANSKSSQPSGVANVSQGDVIDPQVATAD